MELERTKEVRDTIETPTRARGRDELHAWILDQVSVGLITDRASMVEALADAGFDLPLVGKAYLTAQDPDTDERWKGADSAMLLEQALLVVQKAGWQLANIDIVIATEGPRIAPVRARMRSRIAGLLGVTSDDVNVKGKTLEGLGALANGAGVAVQAVCLLERSQG